MGLFARNSAEEKTLKGNEMAESITCAMRLRKEAQDAFTKGLGVSDCPYPSHTSRAAVWMDEMKALLHNKAEMCCPVGI